MPAAPLAVVAFYRPPSAASADPGILSYSLDAKHLRSFRVPVWVVENGQIAVAVRIEQDPLPHFGGRGPHAAGGVDDILREAVSSAGRAPTQIAPSLHHEFSALLAFSRDGYGGH